MHFGAEKMIFTLQINFSEKRPLGSESATFAKFCEISLFCGFGGPRRSVTHSFTDRGQAAVGAPPARAGDSYPVGGLRAPPLQYNILFR